MDSIGAAQSPAASAHAPVHAGRSTPAPGVVHAAASEVAAPAPQAHGPTPEQVREAIEAANKALKVVAENLEFSQDPSTGKTIVRIIDSESKQVIRQFPSEEMLSIARALDKMKGLLLKDKA